MPTIEAVGDDGGPVEAAIEAAVRALRSGEPVVLPTDTVYGIAVDPTRPDATDRLFALKRRPRDVPLAVLVADVGQAGALAELEAAHPAVPALAARFWPGPLTIVLPRRAGLGIDLGSLGSTIGVRCPDHAVPRSLAARVGALATTSANRHGEETATSAPGVVAHLELPGDVLVLDGGPCGGVASTVVDATGRELTCLREGAIPFPEVAAAAR